MDNDQLKNAFNSSSEDEQHHFIKAVETGDLPAVKEFLDKYPSSVDASETSCTDNEKRDRWTGTALTAAAAYQQFEVVKFLLERGADVNLPCVDGGPALSYAVVKNDLAIAELLIENGADVDQLKIHGGAPLIDASACGYEEMMDLLLQNGADIHTKTPNGETALMGAAQFGTVGSVRFLLGHSVDANEKDIEGNTALMKMFWWPPLDGYKETLDLLLEGGLDINAADNKGETALMQGAAREMPPEIIRLFLDKGADPDQKDNNGYTAAEHSEKRGKGGAAKSIKDYITEKMNEEIASFSSKLTRPMTAPQKLKPFRLN